MGLEMDYRDGDTLIDEEEKEALKILSIATKKELDEWEQKNIEYAKLWLRARRRKWNTEDVLTEKFVCQLHKRMFADVWKWAGRYRTKETNIGTAPYHIPAQLKVLLDDCKYWVANNTYPADEIALRFKHRLVSIHCFANGNGRHSRMMADIVAEKLLQQQPFTWGTTLPDARTTYLSAVRLADAGEYESLLKFARK